MTSNQFSLLRRVLAPFLIDEPAERLIRKTARQQWRLIAINLSSSVVQAFSDGATLGVIFLAVESLSNPRALPFPWLRELPPTTLFLSLLGLAVLLQALQSLSMLANTISVGYFAARCRALVTARIHSQVLSFNFPCASGFKVGDLTDFASQGPEAIRQRVMLTSGMLVGILLVVTYLVVLIRLSPWLLLAAALIGGLLTLVQKELIPRLRRGSRHVSHIQAEISGRVTEDFQGLRLLHSSGQLAAAELRLRQRMEGLERALRGQSRRLAVIKPLVAFLPVFSIAIIAAVAVVLFGTSSSGVLPSLVTFVLALQRLNTRMGMLADNLNQLADNSGRMQRLNQILEPKGKQFRRLGGEPFQALSTEICFNEVSLRYAPELPLALKEISFTLPKGKMLALVGTSGAGKSTVADLLVGLYAPTGGSILIDGTPLEQLDLASWQQRLGVVSQDTFLFNATIADNIAFGTPNASREEVLEACVAAQAADFIEAMPLGYDTLVGERGYRLSGGQRQRLSLARAILREPELLILDEATSALDSESERLVQQAIERFERNHTVLVIAHRLSTIVGADEILVMQEGRVVERGSHSSLITRRGLYSQLWDYQSKQSELAGA